MKSTATGKHEFGFSSRHFNKLRKLANDYAGIFVSDDKYEMYYARLAKQVRGLGLDNFDQYVALVESDKDEFREFINAITTNVTSFEREAHQFAFLKESLEARPSGELNIWSAGCSSGQEPYSIVVNIWPVCQRRNIRPHILATDLDTTVLRHAANGIYTLDEIKMYDLSTKRKFFQKGIGSQDGFGRVKKPYRQLVEFRQLNLIHKWPLTTTFDFIFCRNVLIYFAPAQKVQIINQFAERLRPGGILFLGHSETLQVSGIPFKNVGKCVYQKLERA